MSFPIDREVLRLVVARDSIETQITELRRIKKNLDGEIIKALTDDQHHWVSFRYGLSIIPVKPSSTLTLKDESTDAVFTFLEDNARLRQLAGFNSLRIGQVKAVAGDHYRSVDSNGEIHQGWNVMKADHFDEVSDGVYELSVMPEDRAPQFLQRLPDGEGTSR